MAEGRARGITAAANGQSIAPLASIILTATTPRYSPAAAAAAAAAAIPVGVGMHGAGWGLPQHRHRAPSLIPQVDTQVEIVKQGCR